MGFLYPWFRVRSGRIPTTARLTAVGRELVEALRRVPGVRAAFLYGSVARGDHTQRSDIDLALVCQDDALPRVRRLIGDLRRDAMLRDHILVNPNIVTSSQCSAGETRYGPSYEETFAALASLPTSFGGLHELLHPLESDIHVEMTRKVMHNLRRLTREHKEFTALFCDQEVLDVWLENANIDNCQPLHLYMRFARWMLYWQHGTIRDDSKQGIVDAFLSEPAFEVFSKTFRELRRLDLEYDLLLQRAIDGKLRRSAYLEKVYLLVHQAYVLSMRLMIYSLTFMGIRKSQAVCRLGARLAA